jgi:putative DNA primase/helicase
MNSEARAIHDREEAAAGARLSEDDLALLFSESHLQYRYTAALNKWHEYDGIRWRPDTTLRVWDLIRGLLRRIAPELGDKSGRLLSAPTVAHVEKLAQSDRRHAMTPEQWDADVWILNTQDGTLRLKTGELLPHELDDYCTKVTNAGIGEDRAEWLKFLTRVTNDDRELQAFLQRLIGYCLTGETYEHSLPFVYGPGGMENPHS